MKYYSAKPGYIWGSGEQTDEEARKLRIEKFSHLGLEIDENGYSPIVVSQGQIGAITAMGYKLEDIKLLKDTDPVGSILDEVQTVVDKASTPPRPDVAMNQLVQVHIPNMALLSYNETMLIEDSCTDVLQNKLDGGWRILAVCPQSQRRPDYILGRFNPQREEQFDSGARRGY
jgi:hypothetical protein